MPLEERRSVQDAAIGTCYKLVRQMRAVVEGQPAPAVRRVLCHNRIILERELKRIQAVVVSCYTIYNIPWGARIVQALGIGLVVCNRLAPLVHMHMSVHD